jgi:hypothetical protein
VGQWCTLQPQYEEQEHRDPAQVHDCDGEGTPQRVGGEGGGGEKDKGESRSTTK